MPDPLLLTDGPAALVATLPGVLPRPPRDGHTVIAFWSEDYPETAETVTILRDAYPDDEVRACRQVVTDGGTIAAVITYHAPGDEVTAGARAAFLSIVLGRYGIDVRDTIEVTAGRWRSYGCHDSSCCPPEGTPITQGATRP